MGRFIKGDVVVLPFPFSNLSGSKPRPALVVANLNGDDMILCMITRQPRDVDSISLATSDFTTGNLPTTPSYIRPSRLFTGEDTIVLRSSGHISPAKLTQVTNKLIDIITR